MSLCVVTGVPLISTSRGARANLDLQLLRCWVLLHNMPAIISSSRDVRGTLLNPDDLLSEQIPFH